MHTSSLMASSAAAPTLPVALRCSTVNPLPRTPRFSSYCISQCFVSQLLRVEPHATCFSSGTKRFRLFAHRVSAAEDTDPYAVVESRVEVHTHTHSHTYTCAHECRQRRTPVDEECVADDEHRRALLRENLRSGPRCASDNTQCASENTQCGPDNTHTHCGFHKTRKASVNSQRVCVWPRVGARHHARALTLSHANCKRAVAKFWGARVFCMRVLRAASARNGGLKWGFGERGHVRFWRGTPQL